MKETEFLLKSFDSLKKQIVCLTENKAIDTFRLEEGYFNRAYLLSPKYSSILLGHARKCFNKDLKAYTYNFLRPASEVLAIINMGEYCSTEYVNICFTPLGINSGALSLHLIKKGDQVRLTVRKGGKKEVEILSTEEERNILQIFLNENL